MKIVKTLMIFIIMFSCNVLAEENMKVQFGAGKLVVEFPSSFDPPKLSDNGLLLTMDKTGRYTLEMTRLVLEKGMPKDFGQYAVNKMAEERKLKVKKIGDKVILQEPFVQRGEGNDGVKTANFSIGFGSSIVTMTLTTPPKDIMSDEMKTLVNQAVNSAISSLKEL